MKNADTIFAMMILPLKFESSNCNHSHGTAGRRDGTEALIWRVWNEEKVLLAEFSYNNLACDCIKNNRKHRLVWPKLDE